uniref:MHC class I-like antigen recognition-like domain-containing protein n=1 Tax=Terrapene triunguis TaxID=2587831 RepID=A0A674K085_9SAUR
HVCLCHGPRLGVPSLWTPGASTPAGVDASPHPALFSSPERLSASVTQEGLLRVEHSTGNSTCEIRFLQPWVEQGLTPKQWQDLELLIHRSLSNFNRTVNTIAQQQGMGYPFVTQGSLVCELHPNGTSRGFYDTAVNGEDFISFDADTGKWVARQGDKLALYARDLLNQDKGTASMLQFLLRTTCVNQLKSFVQLDTPPRSRRCSHLWGRVCLLFIQGSPTKCSYAAISGWAGGGCLYKDPSSGTEMQPPLGWGRGLFIQGSLAWCTNTAISGVEHSSHFIAALQTSLGQEVKRVPSPVVTAGVWPGQRGQRLTAGNGAGLG